MAHLNEPSELEAEQAKAIRALADETHQPVAEVGRVYLETLRRLETNARVTDYLTLFAARSVRDSVRDNRH